MKTRLLIVGGGFIGLNAGKYFKDLNWEVKILSRFKELDCSNGDYLKCDVTNLEDVEFALEGSAFDYILIAIGSIDHNQLIAESIKNGVYDKYIALINLIKAIDISRIKKVINLGSSLESYGGQTSYAKSNKQTTDLLKLLAEQGELRAITFILPQIYGPGQKNGRLIPDLIDACLVGKQFILNNPEYIREFLFISDLCEAIHKGFESQEVSGIFELGTGKSFSIIEIITEIEKLAKRGIKYQIVPNKKQAEYSPKKILMDEVLVDRVLDWRSKTTISEGIYLTIKEAKGGGWK